MDLIQKDIQYFTGYFEQYEKWIVNYSTGQRNSFLGMANESENCKYITKVKQWNHDSPIFNNYLLFHQLPGLYLYHLPLP